MPLFDREKKEGNMKSLTEEEIQKKLYGDYQQEKVPVIERKKDVEVEINSSKERDYKKSYTFTNTTDEDDLFSSRKRSDNPINATKTVRIEQPQQNITVESINPDEIEESNETFDAEEHIIQENKACEKVDVTFSENTQNPLISNHPTENESSTFRDIYESLRIDFIEFVDKLRSIPKAFIFILVFGFVLLLILFNMWSRRDIEAPSLVNKNISTNVERHTQSIERPMVRVVGALPNATQEAQKNDSASIVDENENSDTQSSMNQVERSFYTIQVCIYQDEERAVKLVNQFKENGFDAFYQKTVTRSNRVLFTVYAGRYENSDSANKAIQEFRKTDIYQEFPDSFIKWLK